MRWLTRIECQPLRRPRSSIGPCPRRRTSLVAPRRTRPSPVRSTYSSLGFAIRRLGQSSSFACGPAQGLSMAAALEVGSASAVSSPSEASKLRILTRPRISLPIAMVAKMPQLPDDFQTAPLTEVDPEIAAVLDAELNRQRRTLEMIASENFVPQAVLDAVGSVLTNKYAEGYPGRRYYGGCEEVDVAEQLAIDRAKELFGAEHANVQAHAGAQANNP